MLPMLFEAELSANGPARPTCKLKALARCRAAHQRPIVLL